MAILIIVALLLTPAFPAKAEGEPPAKPGERQSMITVDGYFNFVPGAWASYDVTDKVKNETIIVRFATLEKEERDGVPGYWMEIYAKPKGQPSVVTRVLCEETPKGPGRPLEVIVQPKGYSPFVVPQSFLEEAKPEEQDLQHVSAEETVKKVKIRVGKRKLQGYKVKGKDNNGDPVTAVVSEQLPPLGLVQAKTKNTDMMLRNFGDGAKSQITGEPMNFYMWIAAQVGGALVGGGTSDQ